MPDQGKRAMGGLATVKPRQNARGNGRFAAERGKREQHSSIRNQHIRRVQKYMARLVTAIILTQDHVRLIKSTSHPLTLSAASRQS